MLTHLMNVPTIGTLAGLAAPRWRKWSAIVAAICCAVPTSASAQYRNDAGAQRALPAVQFQQGQFQQRPFQTQMAPPIIQQVQNTPQSARAIHALIEDMPTSSDELEIIARRSQLVVFRQNVRSVAIADPSVIEVVQYSPKEFAIVGQSLGSTTLTLWFEDRAEPLIYTVRSIRDPNYDSQRKLDYGKLEKKLALIFPNSKVYLIPMSFKILVRGQARDANEAAHILAVIRGEIINQEGSLFGPQAAGGLGGGGFGVGSANTGGYPLGSTSLGGASGYQGIGGIPGGGLGGVAGGLNAYDLAASFIINELQVPGEFQIALRIRVAELNRTMADNAGVNINVLFDSARHAIQSTLIPVGAASTLSGTFENGQIGIFLDWLCSNGTAKILAEPTATVLSGRPVQLLAGGEYWQVVNLRFRQSSELVVRQEQQRRSVDSVCRCLRHRQSSTATTFESASSPNIAISITQTLSAAFPV